MGDKVPSKGKEIKRYKIDDFVEPENDEDNDFEDSDIVWVLYGGDNKYLAAQVYDIKEVPDAFRGEITKQFKMTAKNKPENYRIVKFYVDGFFVTTLRSKMAVFGDGGRLTSKDKEKAKGDPKGFQLALRDFLN